MPLLDGQSGTPQSRAAQRIGGNYPNLGIAVCHFHHGLQATRQDPVVCLHQLAITAVRVDLRECIVVVLDLPAERIGLDESYTTILRRISLGNRTGLVRAAVVDQDVLEVSE